MIDISLLNPLYLQIGVAIIILLGIISGLKDGIVKKFLDLFLFIILVVVMVFVVPPLAHQLEATGFIQNFVNQHLSGDIATIISGLMTGPAYVVLTSLGIMLAYFVIKFFLNFLINRIFHKGVTNRILGAIGQGAFNLVFCGFLMIIIASPSIFKGGQELLTSTQGVKQIYSGVTKVQEVLKDKDLPYSLESILGKALAGKDATMEDIARYQSTLERIPTIIDGVNDGSLADKLVDADGNINQEEANLLLDDFIVFSELVNKLPEDQQETIAEPIKNAITAGRDQLIDENGDAKGTIEVTQEQKDTFTEACSNIGIDEAVLKDFEKCLVIK